MEQSKEHANSCKSKVQVTAMVIESMSHEVFNRLVTN